MAALSLVGAQIAILSAASHATLSTEYACRNDDNLICEALVPRQSVNAFHRIVLAHFLIIARSVAIANRAKPFHSRLEATAFNGRFDIAGFHGLCHCCPFASQKLPQASHNYLSVILVLLASSD